MSNNGKYNIYDEVYKKLLKLDVDSLNVSDFYTLVENMRLPKVKALELIEEELLGIGLTVTQVDRICSSLSFKIRWTRQDARDVEKHLREEGLISKQGFNMIKVKKKNN